MNEFQFGEVSKAKLQTCHPKVWGITNRALQLSVYDFTIIHGYRGKDVQNALFDSGVSKKRFPHSLHNVVDEHSQPSSLAIDFAPWVKNAIDWEDTRIFCVVAGSFFAAAQDLGVRIRWGGDFDSDGSTLDQTFLDFGHIELIL